MPRERGLGRRTVLSLSIGAAVVTAGCLSAGRTPPARETDWRMYGYDPGRTRYVSSATLPSEGVDTAWMHQFSRAGDPPIVAAANVYFFHQNGVEILDAASGDGIHAGADGNFSARGPLAFGKTTAYDDGALLVQYGDYVGGYPGSPKSWPETVGRYAENHVRWWADSESTTTESPEVAVDERPILSDRDVSPIVLGDECLVLHQQTLARRRVDDGTERWRFVSRRRLRNDDATDRLTPRGFVVDTETETVILKTRRRVDSTVLSTLVALDATDGSVEWVSDDSPYSVVEGSLEHQGEDETPTDDSSTYLLPDRDSLAARDGAVYTADWTERGETLAVRKLDGDTGDLEWEYTASREVHNGIAVDETMVYHVGSLGATDSNDEYGPLSIVAIDRADGTRRWEESLDDAADLFGAIGSPEDPITGQPPTVVGNSRDTDGAVTDDGLVLVPGSRGLYALDRDTGEQRWAVTELDDKTTLPAETPAIVSDDRIYVSLRGDLVVFE